MNTSAATTSPKRLHLTDADFARASEALGVEDGVVRAIAAVEAKGSGFLASGEPKILFEPHIFSRLTGGRFDRSHPDLSYPNWKPGAYGPESAQHGRLDRAAKLDRNAALQACSWGAFQVMGFNWKAAGFRSLQAFINAMYAGVDGHFAAMVGFIRSDADMVRALRRHDWASFARLYNGPAFRQNKYDSKLADAYAQHQQGGKRDA